MKIETGTVAMQSSRNYYASQETKTVTAQTSSANDAVILTFSSGKKEVYEQSQQGVYGSRVSLLPDQSRQKESMETETKRELANGNNTEAAGLTGLIQNVKVSQPQETAKSEDEMKLEILRTLISALRRMQRFNAKKGGFVDYSQLDMLENQYSQARKQINMQSQAGVFNITGLGGISGTSGSTSGSNATVWHKCTIESSFVSETENTAYSAQGIVKTADGRSIGFNVNVEMSREFCAEYESITNETYIVTDPLVINLDSDTVNVTDQKFLFDIDSDGNDEEISFVGKGSGFLAIDKNEDGVINDGSELFGTKSGDGFRDLAQYDEDGNGWIDEADSVFDKLKIWTKNEDGEDELIDLRKAGVGAIYLGSADTKFSLNDDETNETNAVIRKTGIYLKESGEVGTMNHIDLVL